MVSEYASWAQRVFGHSPHAWQAALAASDDPAHRTLKVPTGFGKTQGVLGCWLYHRVERGDERWPRRLIWMLPMRTLVEQVEATAQSAAAKLAATGSPQVGVSTLMGGSDAGDWHLHPERPAILIGTQDMLLSRALNRGYGSARARWPMDFGLLSQDALWVLDEVQLMGVGLTTALQLAAFRHESTALRSSFVWAMSATLQDAWLTDTPESARIAAHFQPSGLTTTDKSNPLWSTSAKRATVAEPAKTVARARQVLDGHRLARDGAGTTLVVCNTVDRAVDLHREIVKAIGNEGIATMLLHSRFRGAERRAWLGRLAQGPGEGGRIIVATQVIEAGVDLSADELFTELCPWPSLIQRAGRLMRRGGAGNLTIFTLDPQKEAAPYSTESLEATRDAIAKLDDLSPRGIEAFELSHAGLLDALYEQKAVNCLLREEIDELFDTTPDLSGGDVDVSRFIRDGEDHDVLVCWGPLSANVVTGRSGPAMDARPARDGLCSVPFRRAQDWLCGKGPKDSEPQKLKTPRSAFVWDYIDGEWNEANRATLRPGAVVYVDSSFGGYSPERGFDPDTKGPVALVPLAIADAQELGDSSQDAEDLAVAQYQTIAFHGAAVGRSARLVAESSGLEPRFATLLDLAARWHDVGKAHPAFQAGIVGSKEARRPNRNDLAKAPDSAWKRGRNPYRVTDSLTGAVDVRSGFRHEFASTLALFDVLRRHAPVGHPSRLGEWAALSGADEAEAPREPPSALEREVLDLSAQDFDLVAFLVCSHHGKLRARLHASSADQKADERGGGLPIRGVYEGDALPPVSVATSDGRLDVLPRSELTLEPARLGLSTATGRSWSERVDALRAHFGPFALAYLEAILRAADIRASRDSSLVDPEVTA